MPNLTAYGGSSVAAKIMAKYGFRDGQGLGKQEQGMSMALQVEKTSKRGGRIVHEKDISMPPPGEVPAAATAGAAPAAASTTQASSFASEPSITEIMKSPSKVVLLRVSRLRSKMVAGLFLETCSIFYRKSIKKSIVSKISLYTKLSVSFTNLQ